MWQRQLTLAISTIQSTSNSKTEKSTTLIHTSGVFIPAGDEFNSRGPAPTDRESRFHCDPEKRTGLTPTGSLVPTAQKQVARTEFWY